MKFRHLLVPALILTLAATASAQNTQPSNRMTFSASETLSGLYFSNFENAKFFVCDSADPGCHHWVDGEAYLLICDHNACDGIREAIREAEKQPGGTVYLRVDLIGRKSLQKTAPRFLGDPGQFIKVEKVETVRVVDGQ